MKDAQPKAIALKDYSAPSYWIRNTQLHFALNEDSTTVTNTMSLQRNKAQPDAVLNLDGVDIELLEVKLDGQVIGANHYQLEHEKLIFANLPDSCELTIVNKIYPQNNTSLEGLYRSKTMYCTQCEAEGFRKITYYQDRPDVMSKFTTTISADKAQYPILLSNGNAIKRSDQGSRHSVTWQDPFNKPAYLFALVAGDLEHIEDSFTTASGRDVVLQIYTETANINKVDWAMASLKQSMRWDEKVYGREYDLDIFMIVAVDDFNMGAMENKGLNIFNSSCVLAQAQTTTDAAFQRVEAVVAHEYFHNWSGNRVTCRDWFQLSLKEGFTVFRDQSFSADMGSPTVCRINDVAVLRTAQFAEDAGPMAHPIRPESYIEISNFYTPTIYEKGAEVVGMINTILGPQGFRKGSDLYFQRHDGEAATCEDFVCAMEAANGVELTQFRRWYEQAGTPIVDVTTQYDADNQQYQIALTQHNPDTPGQKDKPPLHIPVRLGLLGDDGQDLVLENSAGEVLGCNPVLAFTQAKQSFIFGNISSEPTPSLLRGFSAPVKLNYNYSRAQLSFLMSSDSDGFNRWEAATRLGVSVLQEMIEQLQQGEVATVDRLLVDAYRNLISQSENLDKAMIASMLELPSEAYLRQLTEQVDPEFMFKARQQARQQITQHLKQELLQCYQNNLSDQSYQPSAEQIAQRALQNQCLSYLNSLPDDESAALAQRQFNSANNMTEVSSALRCLVNAPGAQQGAQLALDKFYQQWRNTPLVVDLWLTIQACSTAPGTLARVKLLMQHPAFEFKNPNKVRALIAAFCMQNSAQFHAADGSGYTFLAEQIIALDKLNPQIAARLLNPLSRWQKFDKNRQDLMKAQLQNILDAPGLSKDSYEIASKSL